ncbi:MAG: copper chaperone PCu(A)C [Acidiferrobacterales bacterium]
MIRQSWLGLVYVILAGTVPLNGLTTELGIEVTDAWVREAPPTAPVLAAYMTIVNTSGHVRTIVGAESPAFERVEIHRTVINQGIARMIRQERVEIPSGGRLKLAPGGYHLMLMKAKQSLKSGDLVDIVLIFAGGARLSLKAPIKKTLDA